MASLYQVTGILCHIVAQIVETELVVGTEGDICEICLTTCLAIGFMLVNAVYAEAVEHVYGAHPLGVTLGKVVVDGNDVHAVACQGIKEYRQSGRQGLTLTGEHLGYLALMQYGTAKELYVEMHHCPYGFVTACNPVVMIYCGITVYIDEVMLSCQVTVELCGLDTHLLALGEAACGALDYSKHLGTNLVQFFLKYFQDVLLQFIYLVKERSTILYLGLWDA